MVIVCGSCKFGKSECLNMSEVAKNAGRGEVVSEKDTGTRMTIVCRPPLIVSGFPFRNREVNRFGTCSQGEDT